MNIAWPKSDVDFNKMSNGIIINVKNNNNLEREFYNYALMFNKSGSTITEHILESTEISKLDTYFFSIAYLYRHSIELIMKAIGFKYIIEKEEQKIFIKETFHNLSEIFQTIKPHIQIQLKKDNSAYEWLTKYFNDINKIDKESDAFRYPFKMIIKKRFKNCLIKPVFDRVKHIDLVTFANKLEIVFELLNSIYLEKLTLGNDYKNYNPIFIAEGGSYYDKSVIGYNYKSTEYYPYVKAYTESAEYLYKKICANNEFKNTFFIPMCYLYRNSIELSLKQIYFEECSVEFQKKIKKLKKKKHSISGLWNLVKNEIKDHAQAPESDKTITNIEKYINQLHNYDVTSDKFRYPTNKNLDIHFNGKKNLDIKNINSFFSELTSFLSSADMMMSAHNEYKAEMESEMDYCYDY